MKIVFSKGGIAYSDFEAEALVLRVHKLEVENDGTNLHINTSTANMVVAARVLVKEGLIPKDKIQFFFEERLLEHDSDGHLEDWPRGFCDHQEDWFTRLLAWQT